MIKVTYHGVSDNLDILPDFISYYEDRLGSHRLKTRIYGQITKQEAELPGITEEVFSDLQEIEAVLQLLEINLRRTKRKHFQKYLEGYNKALSSRDAERYTEGEEDVINGELLINEVALLRNKYLSIMKGLETKGFQLSSITKLKCAGMEDFSMGE
ncbi:Uncharacterised protein [uncultured archaeon]|nr:Uncharacterised protein [uncultured archaeon]